MNLLHSSFPNENNYKLQGVSVFGSEARYGGQSTSSRGVTPWVALA